MALTVSMTTDPTTHLAVATITGDAGDDDLIVDIAETLSSVAAGDHLAVDITGTEHLKAHHLDQLLDHTPAHVVVIDPTRTVGSARVAASLSEARERLGNTPLLDRP